MTAGASESISDASLENNSEKADDNQDSINQAEEANE